MKSRLIIISEFFYPDENATGYLLTQIAKGLAGIADIRVLCRKRKDRFCDKETLFPFHDNIVVERIHSTGFNKDKLVLRIINILTLSISLFLKLLTELQEGDRVIVVTNPPSLPFIAAIACRLKRARYSILVHDVYPEVLIATKVIHEGHLIALVLRWMTKKILESSENVIVLGRDMAHLLTRNYRTIGNRINIIPNWGDIDSIFPKDRLDNSILNEVSLEKKFVVQYVGNIGRTHNVELLVECAELLRDRDDIHFLFIGDGAKRRWLLESIKDRNLKNVIMKPFYPRNRQSDVHNACDIVVISFIPGMAGISVPSRMYNIMAAGKPIIGITDTTSELARVIQEEGIGWVIPSYHAQDVVKVIMAAQKENKELRTMGLHARKAAEEKYSFEKIIPLYRNLFISKGKG